MKNIMITATAERVEQAQALIDAGVDRIYVGEKDYGLRLPQTLSYDEINRIAQLVHAAGKELTVAVNALMHQSMMDSIKPFLDFLKEIQADYITVGDAGVFYVLKRDGYPFKTTASSELLQLYQDRRVCDQRSGSVLGRARRSKFSLLCLRGQTWNPYLLE